MNRHGLTVTDDSGPIAYIDRTHAWYDALGTGNRYRYAEHTDVPFTRLTRSLAQSTVALLTTAVPYDASRGDQSVNAPYNAAAKFYAPYALPSEQDHDLRVGHVSINRREMVDDANCWFPLPALRRAHASGRIGSIARHVYGVPTNRSQRHTISVDAPEVLRRCQADGVDAAILVPNCPVCHQTMSLVARHLEAAGIATVVMGAALDIVERCGVARLLFSDVPLGSAAALPGDVHSQDSTLALALDLLETAEGPRTTHWNPLRWPGDPDWKRHVYDWSSLTPAELQHHRDDLNAQKQAAHEIRDRTLERDHRSPPSHPSPPAQHPSGS